MRLPDTIRPRLERPAILAHPEKRRGHPNMLRHDQSPAAIASGAHRTARSALQFTMSSARLMAI